MKNNIFVCFTVRHLFTALSMTIELSGEKNLILIATDHQQLDTSLFDLKVFDLTSTTFMEINESKLIRKFKRGNIFSCSRFLSNNLYLGSKGFFRASDFINTEINKELNLDPCSEIFMFHDKTFISKYFLGYENVTLIEDGLANYLKTPVSGSLLKRVVRLVVGLNPNYQVLGETKKVKKILLVNPINAPAEIKEKCFSFEEVFLLPSKEKKRLINTFFNINRIDQAKVIFLTQGLDVAGLCDQETKMKIYNEVLNELVKIYGEGVFVKLHPSETMDEYTPLLNESINFLPAKVPFEALALQFAESEVTCMSLYTSALTISSGKFVSPINLVLDSSIWSGERRFDKDYVISEAKKNINEYYKKNLR